MRTVRQKMLTGRESLIRLIGKRRQVLPNRHCLLSTPTPNSLNLEVDGNGALVSIANMEKSKNTKSKEEDVACPVCMNTISGGNHMINLHLDACLSRGIKRKLTQTTLLQSRFWSEPKVKCQSGVDEKHFQPNHFSEDGANCDISELREQHRISKAAFKHDDSSSSDSIFCKVDAPSSPDNEALEKAVPTTLDDTYGLVLDTFIVGRKFSGVQELNIDAKISLVRDPDNIKDHNALKVLSVNTEPSEMLGYLPKEVSRYLSPLVDKYNLKFEGFVTSTPKFSYKVVPIKILCYNPPFSGRMKSKDFGDFKSLWNKVLQGAEFQNKFPPEMPRYQNNFNILIQEVLRSYSHLFTAVEMAFLESFPSLSEDSQRLFIRLYTRNGPWFRQSNISYPEISDSQQALKDLAERGFMSLIEDANELDDQEMKEIIDTLNVSELRDIVSMNKISSHSLRKRDLIASLCSSYSDGTSSSLGRMILERTGLCAKISTIAGFLIWRIERLFFLNAGQDLSSFVLLDLGIVKYPTYNCIVSDQIFSHRTELVAYEEAIEVAQIMDESLDKNHTGTVLKCIMIADSHLSPNYVFRAGFTCFTASWAYSKVVLLGISFLEHHRRYNEAVYLLRRLLSCFHCDGRRGYWTVRLSTDLEHIGLLNESLSVAENALSDPWVRAGSRVALQRRILRLAKPPRRWKIPSFSGFIETKIPEVHIMGRPLNCEVGMKNRFYGEDGEQCGVEQLALQYYGGEGGGWRGIHSESGIWLTLFGLLMWDILFVDIPDVFRTRFQNAPLDLETDAFYLNRKNQIEAHLTKIANGMAEELLIISWETHHGEACRGVAWERFSLEELRAAVTCAGGPCVASLCQYLAKDYRNWSSGMPDLLLWRFKENGLEGEAKLVEVKSARDRLSEQQRACLLLLMDCGFSVELCHVKPS